MHAELKHLDSTQWLLKRYLLSKGVLEADVIKKKKPGLGCLMYQAKVLTILTLPTCDFQEQSTIAKLGLELRLLTSDVDSEVERWEDQEHDIARQSQSISSMAYSMYLFTRYAQPRKRLLYFL